MPDNRDEHTAKKPSSQSGRGHASLWLRHSLFGGFSCGALIMLILIAGFMLTRGYGPGSSAYQTGFIIVAVLGVWLVLLGKRRVFTGVARAMALLGGLLAVGTAAAGYVLTWELYLWFTDYAFIENYLERRHNTIIRQAPDLVPISVEQKIAMTEALRERLLSPAYRLRKTALELIPSASITLGIGLTALYRLSARRPDEPNQ